IRPRVGLMNFVSRLKQVVLPAPFGPISAWMVPRATRRLTPFTATKPANSLVRSSVSRMMSPLIDVTRSPQRRLLEPQSRDRVQWRFLRDASPQNDSPPGREPSERASRIDAQVE